MNQTELRTSSDDPNGMLILINTDKGTANYSALLAIHQRRQECEFQVHSESPRDPVAHDN
jgi:hypothetical protein